MDSGGQGRNRTTDTRIFSPLLYRLSYLAFRDAPGAGARKQRRDYKVKCHPGQANRLAGVDGGNRAAALLSMALLPGRPLLL